MKYHHLLWYNNENNPIARKEVENYEVGKIHLYADRTDSYPFFHRV